MVVTIITRTRTIMYGMISTQRLVLSSYNIKEEEARNRFVLVKAKP